MLEVQKHLRTYGLQNLVDQLKIKVKEHATLPLVILNYDQIETPKTHPIAMECRGLILEKDTWNVVASGFKRFFNYGEALEITGRFEWDEPIECYTKEDGSYINVFYYRNGYTSNHTGWRMSTRGSFGLDELPGYGGRWLDLVHGLLPDIFYSQPDVGITYVFELTSPYNKVVRHYREPALTLLTMTAVLENGQVIELPSAFCDMEAKKYGFRRPDFHRVESYKDVEILLRAREADDPTFEGFVLRDINGLRLKVKTSTYLALHRLRGEGDNMYSAKNLVPLILANEGDEILTYFPEVEATWKQQEEMMKKAYDKLAEVWWMCQDYEEQKAFAIYITKTNPTPFSGILFKMKQEGTLEDESVLKRMWRDSSDLILKHVFGRK